MLKINYIYFNLKDNLFVFIFETKFKGKIFIFIRLRNKF